MLAIITERIKKHFNITLKLRVSGIYLAVTSAALIVAAFFVMTAASNTLYEDKSADLFAKANIIAESMVQTDDTEYVKSLMSQSLAGTGIRGALLSSAGSVIYDTVEQSQSTGKILSGGVIAAAQAGGQEQELTTAETGELILSAAVPVNDRGAVTGTVYLTRQMTDVTDVLAQLRLCLIIFGLFMLAVVFLLSISVGAVVTSPLSDFISTAQEISKGNFDSRIKLRGNKEIDKLAEAMNYMCSELEHLESKRRKFVSDASHELKTPMATIKLLCDSITATENPDLGMVREFLSDLSEEVDRLTRIIDNLLAMTKIDSGEIQLSKELVDFGMMLQKIKNKLTPLAMSKNITVTLDVQADMMPVMIDYDRIWEAVYNIVDNAIKYSKIGGGVLIKCGCTAGELVLEVFDSGPGIPDEFKERIFERFYRLDDSRARETGGTGLGLSISKEAVLLHGGDLRAEDNPDGGSCFIMRLPINEESDKRS